MSDAGEHKRTCCALKRLLRRTPRSGVNYVNELVGEANTVQGFAWPSIIRSIHHGDAFVLSRLAVERIVKLLEEPTP